jgi:hypothetical protein
VAQLFSLGDFRFMKLYRILGILWFAFCCYGCFDQVRAMFALPLLARMWIPWCVLIVLCLLYLCGVMASWFLIRGARWARWYITALAILVAFAGVYYMLWSWNFPAWRLCVTTFSGVSLVLLLLPKHEPVA